MGIVSPRDLLLPYQRKYNEDQSRFKALLAARQTGKDFTQGEEVARDCMTVPRNTWLIVSPSERQSLEALEKVKEWTSAYELAIEDYQEEREGGPGTLIKSATVTYGNGSRAIAVPGRPETVRGFSANVDITEFGFLEKPRETWKALLPSITNPLRGGLKKARIQSSANGKTGPGGLLYEIFDKNLFNLPPGTKPAWSCHTINIYEAVAQGLPVDIEEIRAALDDPIAFAQEYMNEFLDSTNVLLPYDLIALAESFQASEVVEPEFFRRPMNRLFCGIDFGRTSDPTIIVTLEQIGDILWVREVLELKNMSTVDQNNIADARIAASTRTCEDYTGPGIGFGDYAARRHGEWKPDGHSFGKVELCTFTKKFKRQIFPNLRRKFEAPTKLRVPISVVFREDCHAMQQIINAGEYDYVAPRTKDGHSDRCTALALAVRAAGEASPFAFELSPLQRRGVVNRNFNRRSIA